MNNTAKYIVIFCPVCLLQTPSDAPWTESSDIKVDDSNVLGYVALTRFEQWAKDVAPTIYAEFDQATLFSGSVHYICHSDHPHTRLQCRVVWFNHNVTEVFHRSMESLLC